MIIHFCDRCGVLLRPADVRAKQEEPSAERLCANCEKNLPPPQRPPRDSGRIPYAVRSGAFLPAVCIDVSKGSLAESGSIK